MALTFPLALPYDKFAEVEFTPVRRQNTGAKEDGDDFVIDRGVPVWKIRLLTNGLTETEFSAWEAWVAALRGRQRSFLAYDPRKAYPLAYMPGGWGAMTRAGGGSFDGSATVTAISASRDTPTFGTLPVGFTLSPGDHVGLSQSSRYSMHRVIEAAPAAANGSGVLAVQVEPELPAFLTTSAAAQFLRGPGKFRLVDPLPVMTAQAMGGSRPGTVEIHAVSTIR